ncbi:hypothetical protein GJ703_00275 [Clostridium botulinum]|nr:hypothetical protein GJ703_00275 [Clostridium botulinum]
MIKFKSWIKDAPIELLHNMTPYKFAKETNLDINESTSFLHSLYKYEFALIKINVKCPECKFQNTIYLDENFNETSCVECEGPIDKRHIKNGELIYVLKDECFGYFKDKALQQKKVLDPMNLLLKDTPYIFSKENNVINMEDYSDIMIGEVKKEIKKPKIFIGSSKEHLDVAYSLQEALEYSAEPTVWTQGIFKLSSNTLDDLYNNIKGMDAGIFIFTPDDISDIRENSVSVVRDNVIFELGLAIGILGKQNVFYIIPRGCDFHIPSDLAGITPGDYDANRSDDNLVAALGPVVTKIMKQLKN